VEGEKKMRRKVDSWTASGYKPVDRINRLSNVGYKASSAIKLLIDEIQGTLDSIAEDYCSFSSQKIDVVKDEFDNSGLQRLYLLQSLVRRSGNSFICHHAEQIAASFTTMLKLLKSDLSDSQSSLQFGRRITGILEWIDDIPFSFELRLKRIGINIISKEPVYRVTMWKSEKSGTCCSFLFKGGMKAG
jgi:ribosomal protein S16